MRTVEVTQSERDPFVKKILDLQDTIDNINRELLLLGYPVIDVKIGSLEDVREYVSNIKQEKLEDTTTFYDLKNKIAVK